MRTNPFYDAWLFLTGLTGEHTGSGVGPLLVVLFWVLFLASVCIAWRNSPFLPFGGEGLAHA